MFVLCVCLCCLYTNIIIVCVCVCNILSTIQSFHWHSKAAENGNLDSMGNYMHVLPLDPRTHASIKIHRLYLMAAK